MAYVPISSCEGGAVFVLFSLHERGVTSVLISSIKGGVVYLPANSRKKVWFVPVKKSVVFVPEDPFEVGMAYVPVSSSKKV